jgi:hypothetical protein
MARTVIALYDEISDAHEAVRDLQAHGFDRENISLVVSNIQGRYNPYLAEVDNGPDQVSSETIKGAEVGAEIGAIIGGLGGLLVGLGALTVPGIGPVLAAGPLALAFSTLTGVGAGAVVGGVTGGAVGALVDMGVPEQEAGYYYEGVRRGGTLVTVLTSDETAEQARDILNMHNPVDLNERVASWIGRGWNGYEPGGKPYTSDELERERAYYGTLLKTQTGTGYNAGYGAGNSVPDGVGDEENREDYEALFHHNYESLYRNNDVPYEYYHPAYRFGYELAENNRFEDKSWEEVEPEARREWEERNENISWEVAKDPIRYAWNEVKDRIG